MNKEHNYQVTIRWTGNKGAGTADYGGYSRDHIVSIPGKPDLPGSSDTAFRGDKTRHNPEDMLLSALATCHMLWYLHLCADAGVIVTAYEDHATGVMVESPKGGGKFEEATLHPKVTVTDAGMVSKAAELHKKANECCFIANSVNFPVRHQPTVVIQEGTLM
jgi:organic hydroperoxide reductase OsmC/OhrA